HVRCHARFDAALDLVVRLVISDSVHQVVPLVGVRVLLLRHWLGGPDHVGAVRILAFEGGRGKPAIAVFGDDGHAFAAVGVTGINIITTVYAAPIHSHLGAIGECVFD